MFDWSVLQLLGGRNYVYQNDIKIIASQTVGPSYNSQLYCMKNAYRHHCFLKILSCHIGICIVLWKDGRQVPRWYISVICCVCRRKQWGMTFCSIKQRSPGFVGYECSIIVAFLRDERCFEDPPPITRKQSTHRASLQILRGLVGKNSRLRNEQKKHSSVWKCSARTSERALLMPTHWIKNDSFSV